MDHEKILLPEQREMLITDLQVRFSQHMSRHVGLEWAKIQAKLEQQPAKLWSLAEMERTGGEPDVLAYDPQSDSYLFFDCAAESPAGRRSACYDRAAQTSRKAHPPAHNALDLALAMGIELLTEADYRRLQTFGAFDTKTSSWLHTPSEIRSLGGAIFGDRRYNQVFVYHNGADSYYAARGFRGLLRV
ncbi:conserved hypothetical protein [Herpetosiphon aurantiacus DSM 785]|uniref:DUF4256 domain-containing protein n=2 Tax=Herpetosiphon TaxID=64 RepID=A9B7T5_HERA2|nr:DUF4256 domain-containing protein [Herpetosiphon sp.]ABX04463.1 conserved hypothetical protein [Herpetosiphon aurantiacus DSM 785]